MLKSMTGFGRAEQTINDKTYLVEIKSLNGKQLEVNLKIPPLLKTYEFEIRNLLQEKLIRGTVECLIMIKQNGGTRPVVINTDLIKVYYRQIDELANELKIDTTSVLSALLRLPEVVTPSTEELKEEDWINLKQVIDAALNEVNRHREDEGAMLEKELLLRIQNINNQEDEILRLEPKRRQRMKAELIQLLEENAGKENYDANRMEQELIYYIEKIDIREEQVRLKNHCEYFRSILKENEEAKGKKMAFVIQEIGREINTTGSKAYDADIQKCVVLMKDELEKAKEQIFNVL
ncbi:MAG TPA: YicC/YloC family endoribonuclease [Chitinophagaceae bacterium]|nr:YicC/YloC family endoribonuclease [Chitinophagaceae bacterium]